MAKVRVISVEDLDPELTAPPKITGDRAQKILKDFMLSIPTDNYTEEEIAFREKVAQEMAQIVAKSENGNYTIEVKE